MELRSHLLNVLINDEVEAYLKENDVIIVPFGPTELHGGLPLDCETILAEGIALLMAERTNSLVLPHVPYIYSGATASGKGTIQLTVRESADMLQGLAHSLLRSGFKKQIYISLHGPAHISMNPVVRDFFDETGVAILYIDGMITAQKSGVFSDLKEMMLNLDKMILGAYKLRNRLDDILLTSEYAEPVTQTPAAFGNLSAQAFQSGATGYYFKEHSDHMATSAIPDIETRDRMAEEGLVLLNKMVDTIDFPTLLKEMAIQEDYLEEVYDRYPHVPAAYKRRKNS